ncbi:hypothetical protein Dxin01_00164 [Deinococcus xinjiangensis]|uniref:Uncharacterized protein n=1 Tax=Deinococcus xinjiangensis TaxID=457454 RepID=A0ABP9V574_9DEIO
MNNLLIRQNTTFRATARLTDPSGQALDPSGWKVWSQVREAVDASLVVGFTVKAVGGAFSSA